MVSVLMVFQRKQQFKFTVMTIALLLNLKNEEWGCGSGENNWTIIWMDGCMEERWWWSVSWTGHVRAEIYCPVVWIVFETVKTSIQSPVLISDSCRFIAFKKGILCLYFWGTRCPLPPLSSLLSFFPLLFLSSIHPPLQHPFFQSLVNCPSRRSLQIFSFL